MTVRADVLLIVSFWYPVRPSIPQRGVILDLLVLAFETEVGIHSKDWRVQPSVTISLVRETET
jgi:hypothetical protein